MTLRPTDEQDQALSRLAAVWGVSKQVAALRAIEEMDARQYGLAEVEQVTRELLDQRQAVIERLAQT